MGSMIVFHKNDCYRDSSVLAFVSFDGIQEERSEKALMNFVFVLSVFISDCLPKHWCMKFFDEPMFELRTFMETSFNLCECQPFDSDLLMSRIGHS